MSPGEPSSYVPFGHRDMEGLIAALPPLTQGADEWISTLESQWEKLFAWEI